MKELENKNLHKEIDLIQDCIKRMASNSFLLKGWAISLVIVVMALSARQVNPYFLGVIVLVPLFSFWYLDAFFLLTERMYIEMYKWVINERPKGNTDKMYDLNPHRFKNELKIEDKGKPKEEWKIQNEWFVMKSKTLRWFYLTPVVLVVLSLTVYAITQASSDSIDAKHEVVVTEKELVQQSEKPEILQSSLKNKELGMSVEEEVKELKVELEE